MTLRTAAAALVLMTTLVGCGSGGEPARTPAHDTTTATATPTTEAQTTTDTETTEASGGYAGAVANTYDVAAELCRVFGVKAVAREYGSAANAFDAATAYSLDSVKRDGHRQAAFEGCLAGFQKK